VACYCLLRGIARHQPDVPKNGVMKDSGLIEWGLVGVSRSRTGGLPYEVHLASPSVSAGAGTAALPMKMTHVWEVFD
jgi:hypothetical protein